MEVEKERGIGHPLARQMLREAEEKWRVMELGELGKQEPLEVVAANERSPNRKPRWKRAGVALGVMQAKRLWLRIYQLTGELEVACTRVGRSEQLVYRWVGQDPWFRKEKAMIDETWKQVRGGQIESITGQAIEVVKESMDQTEDGRLRAEVAMRILRSRGYMPDKSEVVVSAGDGDGVAVKIVTVEARGPEGEA